MFSVFCPTHDTRVLLTRRNAISFWNTDEGPAIVWRCTCGHEGLLTRDGSQPFECDQAADLAPEPVDGDAGRDVAGVGSAVAPDLEHA